MKIFLQEESAKALMEEDFCRVCGSDGVVMKGMVDFELKEIIIETVCVDCKDKGSYSQSRYPVLFVENIEWLEDDKEYKYNEYSWDGPAGNWLVIETPEGVVTITTVEDEVG
jgi:hypothetical protein